MKRIGFLMLSHPQARKSPIMPVDSLRLISALGWKATTGVPTLIDFDTSRA